MSSSDPWLVVGLGNPGAQYAATRHNVGQMVVAELAERMRGAFKPHKANARVAEGRVVPGGPRCVLALPNTYMNVSGGPVNGLLKYFGLPPERLIVVHDELDIPFDALKLKQGGGHGGHNGLRDIIAATGSNDFVRVRVGIGRPPGRQQAADFVLQPFSSTERQTLPNLVVDAADAVELIAADGLTAAQLKVHTAG
ncbi:aminoacyl-tRNA hydrolase [Herbiconiux moechotypicola]|uniref:Peptidyl-tRNA hydrolase n=1 Tax=Herbiconiux moechotypicola TaxID=637393 RepID=A0ABN3E6S7_9MICO|nr:aminoacyl-tRNA hydrolase [Herbiconiux moechotypicola]MCS5731879.1 aminoacyl-tRNA hydrolase [Herbiconiux moechotypicola]